MIRFKVVRASRLLLGLAIVVLVAVLALFAVNLAARQQPQAPTGTASLVERTQESDEARTEVVFASSDRAADAPFDPADAAIEIEVLTPTAAPVPMPKVLIYHTHTHEAYEQVAEDPYEAIEAWRTADADHSVVRVGEALAEGLRGYGFDVTHDATDHEGTQLSTAYTRSLATLEGYGEPFDLYIDLHRDAYVAGEVETATLASGEAAAPLMLLIGNGNGFSEKPYYRENLAFAQALEARINTIEPGLCKPVLVKDGRYNQHIGVFAVLVEVGHNRNTLAQALNAVPTLAEAIDDLLIKRPDPELAAMKSANTDN